MGTNERTYLLSSEEKQTLKEALKEGLGGRTEVLFAYLYGSVLDDMNIHDIDVGLYVSGVSEEGITGCAIEIATMLQSITRVPVDVRIINFAPLSFQYKVLRGELLFERDENARSAVAERVSQRYLDIEPLLRRGFKEAFAA